MNKVVLMGRLTKDPEVRYSKSGDPVAVARYTLAVSRRFKRQGEQEADFISCIAFGKAGEFAEKYLAKGMQIAIVGRIQTGHYEKDGRTVYTTDVVVEEQHFTGSKESGQAGAQQPQKAQQSGSGFYPADDIEDDDLPF